MYDLIIENGSVVLPSGTVQGNLLIEKGRIVGIAAGGSGEGARETVDATGMIVLPGVVDPHIHFGLGGARGKGEEKFAQDFESETKAAVNGGVTTLVTTALFSGANRGSNLPCFRRAIEIGNDISYIDFKLTAFMLNNDHVREISELIQIGVTSFKLLMAYRGEEGKQVGATDIGWGLAYKTFAEVSQHRSQGALAMVHAESAEIIDVLREEVKATGRNDLEAWNDSRPSICEAVDIFTAGTLAQEAGARLYFPHVSSQLGLDAANTMKAKGAEIFVETCPHYLSFTDSSSTGILGKVNPPLRDEDDQNSLWEAISNGGIDTIGTDHATYQRSQKEEGGLWDSYPGFGSLGLSLPLLISEGIHTGRVTWEKIAKITAETPAKLFGMSPRKGTLLPGADADVAIVDPNIEWTISADNLHSASNYSIYEGKRIKGQVVKTILRGKTVADLKNGLEATPSGQYVGLARN